MPVFHIFSKFLNVVQIGTYQSIQSDDYLGFLVLCGKRKEKN